MKKIGILTTFSKLDNISSKYNIVKNQIKMLLLAGYNPKLVVLDDFEDESIIFKKVEIIKLPIALCNDNGELPDDYQEKFDNIKKIFYEFIKDLDIIITHDIVYNLNYLIYNIICKEISNEFQDLKWLNWLYNINNLIKISDSENIKEILSKPFINSFLICNNSADIHRIALDYNVEENNIKCVNDSVDICDYFEFSNITRRLITEKDILSADIIACYPMSWDRNCQIEILIKIFNSLKIKFNKKVRLIIIDFNSEKLDTDKDNYINEIDYLLNKLNLDNIDITFTSRYDTSLKNGCDKKIIKDFMLLSNIFILPSRNDIYSFIAQEAMLSNNFIILNRDYSPFKNIYKDCPRYFQFSSNVNALNDLDGVTTTTYKDEKEYWYEIANYIIYELNNNRVLMGSNTIRKERNLKYIMKNQLEPLFYN